MEYNAAQRTAKRILAGKTIFQAIRFYLGLWLFNCACLIGGAPMDEFMSAAIDHHLKEEFGRN